MRRLHTLPLLAAAALASCNSMPASTFEGCILDTRTGELVSPAECAAALAGNDVVFLGEQHDSLPGHELQLAITRSLHEQRGALALSLEMFERDVQETVDAYLAGDIDDETFLAEARPWKHYAERYRPAVEWARESGSPVLAANTPRALVGRVRSEGWEAVRGEPFAPRSLDTSGGPYRERFVATLTEVHPEATAEDLDAFFRSQRLWDEGMAETIADFVVAAGDDAPLVAHWCGAFHCEHRLGTVERLLARVPDLEVGVVTMITQERRDLDLDDDALASADFAILVPASDQ